MHIRLLPFGNKGAKRERSGCRLTVGRSLSMLYIASFSKKLYSAIQA